MDLLKRILRHGDPVVICFIIEAIRTKAQNVVDDGLAEWPEHHIISREKWLQVAKELLDQLK